MVVRECWQHSFFVVSLVMIIFFVIKTVVLILVYLFRDNNYGWLKNFKEAQQRRIIRGV